MPHNVLLLLFLFMFLLTSRRHWTPRWNRLAQAVPSAWSCAKSTGDFLATCSFLRYRGDREKRRRTGANLCRLMKTLKWPPPDPPVCLFPPCLVSTSRRPTPTGTASDNNRQSGLRVDWLPYSGRSFCWMFNFTRIIWCVVSNYSD